MTAPLEFLFKSSPNVMRCKKGGRFPVPLLEDQKVNAILKRNERPVWNRFGRP